MAVVQNRVAGGLAAARGLLEEAQVVVVGDCSTIILIMTPCGSK